MLREYTAWFTSVNPCLYQPPPGTVIEVVARPAGVKLHVPARSTDPIAPLPAVTPSTCDNEDAGTGSAVAGGGAGTAMSNPRSIGVKRRRRGSRRCRRMT